MWHNTKYENFENFGWHKSYHNTGKKKIFGSLGPDQNLNGDFKITSVNELAVWHNMRVSGDINHIIMTIHSSWLKYELPRTMWICRPTSSCRLFGAISSVKVLGDVMHRIYMVRDSYTNSPRTIQICMPNNGSLGVWHMMRFESFGRHVIYTHIHICICIYIHTRIHTHTHTHINIVPTC